MEGERERVEVNSERICLDCFLCPNSCGECLEVNADFEVESVWSSCDVSVGVLASFPAVTIVV